MSEKNSLNVGTDDEPAGAIYNQYEWSSIEPSAAVVEAVSQAANCDYHELSPLYDCIDPDAFDAILAPPIIRNTETTTSISFSYAGYTVTVQNTGTVHLTPA